jgi:hypothetical protein
MAKSESESELTRWTFDCVVKGELLFYIKRCRIASLGHRVLVQETHPKRENYWS